MVRSLKVPLGIIGLSALVLCGFVFGRAMGGRGHAARASKGLSAMLPFRPRLDSAMVDPEPDPHIPPDQVFEDVLDKVQQNYVDGGANNARLSNGALARMLASLDDPRTSYLEPVYREARQDALKGRYHGIGAVLTVTRTKKSGIEYRQLSIVDVMPGSPAEKAGLGPHDVITHIDGHWIITYSMTVESDRIAKKTTDEDDRSQQMKEVSSRFKKGCSLTKALGLLAIGESKTLDLTYLRGQQSTPNTVQVKTGLTEVDPVEYRVLPGKNGKLAYLRVRQFNARATHLFQQALDGMAASGANLKGLIIDLRGNPGGVRADSSNEVDGFTSSRKLMARLTRGGAVAVLERHPGSREPLTITGAKPAVTLPRIVLVDQGTANISEMVAAALRDSGARIAGVHTFGDNILQLFTVLKSGGGAEITTAHLFTTSGADLGKGIEPDLPLPPAEASTDAAVRFAQAKLGT